MIRASPDGTAVNWWLRSVNCSNTNNFCNVNSGGSNSNNNANNSWGFAPGFKKIWARTSSGIAKPCPKLKGGLVPWRLTPLWGFIPKHATRYGCPDASCMAG